MLRAPRTRRGSNLSSRQPRSGRNRAEQSGWSLELAVLESIENLFESELDAREHSAMSASHPVCREGSSGEWQHRRTRDDDEREMRDDEAETHDPACCRAHRRDEPT